MAGQAWGSRSRNGKWELMGGRIGVESNFGEGSRFYFEVPLARVGAKSQDSRTVDQSSFRERSGLWRKAARSTRWSWMTWRRTGRFCGKSSKSIGCGVRVVESGEQALKEIQSERPDIVFLDIRMPGMDGMETARRMRTFRESKESEIPKLVAISASVLAHEQQRYFAAGFRGLCREALPL